MNENSKIYIVLGVIVAIIGIVIGFNIYTEKQSEKIYNEFNKNLNSSEEKIVFIGRKTCSWCQLFQPIFDYYVEKYEFDYQYIDTEELVNKHFNKVLKSLNISSDDFGTPVVVFLKDGKVIEKISGYVDERALLDILQKRGYAPEDEKDMITYLDFAGIKKIFNSKEKSIIVIGQSSCSYCIKFKPVLMNISENKNININYFNYDEIEEHDELSDFLEQFEVFQKSWGTPLTIIVQDGKIINSFSGYSQEANYVNFLEKNELIKK